MNIYPNVMSVKQACGTLLHTIKAKTPQGMVQRRAKMEDCVATMLCTSLPDVQQEQALAVTRELMLRCRIARY